MIQYIKKDLFSAPAGSTLVHATNCKGVWGNGIAKTFSIKFPKAFKDYQFACKNSGTNLAGSALLLKTPKYEIGCLFTSRKYGLFKDSQDTILNYTEKALLDLVIKMHKDKGNDFTIHMPKINSGLFAVDWKETEKIIKNIDAAATKQKLNITWLIYSP